MPALRSVLASVLLAVLAVGGVVLPSVHRAAHGLEIAEARAAHIAAYHSDAAFGGDQTGVSHAEVPCPPGLNDVDCAICVGVSGAVDLGAVAVASPEVEAAAYETHADRVRVVAASGSGARAPPVG